MNVNKVTNAMTTIIENKFTGYHCRMTTVRKPAVITIRQRLRDAKASDCLSTTTIHCDGIEMELRPNNSGKVELLAR
jgi:hypothetical protein